MADLLEMNQNSNERNESPQQVMNIMGDEFVWSQRENKNFITEKLFLDKIKFLQKQVGNKNNIAKTLSENINCLKNNFLKIEIPFIILIRKF